MIYNSTVLVLPHIYTWGKKLIVVWWRWLLSRPSSVSLLINFSRCKIICSSTLFELDSEDIWDTWFNICGSGQNFCLCILHTQSSLALPLFCAWFKHTLLLLQLLNNMITLLLVSRPLNQPITGKSTVCKTLSESLNATLLGTPPGCLRDLRSKFDAYPSMIRRAFYSLGNYISAQEIATASQTGPVVVDRYVICIGRVLTNILGQA